MAKAEASPHDARSRAGQLERLGNESFDVLVLGGGISGVSAARVLTLRGHRVALIDNDDFASGTSQESSQLIWGGIKYLENRQFKVVHELCLARNALAAEYPDRVEPLAFLYPRFSHDPHWLTTLLAGAFVYWVMGRGFAGRPRRLKAADISRLAPRIRSDGFSAGLQYFDARMVDSDARLTLDFLFDAMNAGLVAVNHVSVRGVRLRADNGSHELDVEDKAGGARFSIRAKWIVNTTGVWVDEVNAMLGARAPHRHLFSKGAHLIIPKLETSGRALTCLSREGRVFFVIPWGRVTLVGTTDTLFEGGPARVRADAGDVEYLRAECEAKFKIRLSDEDLLNTKAGLRPLIAPAGGRPADFLSLARSHAVWSDPKSRITALWGGKYTNCFLMAGEIADTVSVAPSLPPRARIAACVDFPRIDDAIPGDPESIRPGLVEACRRELVVTLEDLLRRRTNIALKIPRGGRGRSGENEPTLRFLAGIVAEATGVPDREVIGRFEAGNSQSC